MTHTAATDRTDRTCLLAWRLFSLGVAVALAACLHSWEASGAVAIFGEHAGECVEYIGEWFGRM